MMKLVGLCMAVVLARYLVSEELMCPPSQCLPSQLTCSWSLFETEPERLPHRKVTEEVAKAIRFKPLDFPKARIDACTINSVDRQPGRASKKSVRSLKEDIAEHEAFITLLDVIETARSRKKELLGLIEDANALMTDQLPFGGHDSSVVNLSDSAKKHLRWLWTNLGRTNKVLDTSLKHLRTLYGDVYLPST
jgi:hypothetical protein